MKKTGITLAAAVCALGALAATSSAHISVDWNSADPVLELQQRLPEQQPALAAPPSTEVISIIDKHTRHKASLKMLLGRQKCSSEFQQVNGSEPLATCAVDIDVPGVIYPVVIVPAMNGEFDSEIGTDVKTACTGGIRRDAGLTSRLQVFVALAPTRFDYSKAQFQECFASVIAKLSAKDRILYFDAASPPSNSGYGACLKRTGYGHGYCRGAKGGYQDCIDNGYQSSTCKGADLGYRACIANGHSHSTCLDAKGGYQDCLDGGAGHSFCKNADAGFKTCIANGRGAAECKNAKGGYAACLAGGHDHFSCLEADLGYKACRDNGREHSSCRDAREGYGDCIATGYSHNSCT